ncbi:hypothetical protein [Aeromonas salmonicida]|nr:hypothetical protein [Aeromonas salmonicida]
MYSQSRGGPRKHKHFAAKGGETFLILMEQDNHRHTEIEET